MRVVMFMILEMMGRWHWDWRRRQQTQRCCFWKAGDGGMLPSLEASAPSPKSNLQLSSQCGTAPGLTKHLWWVWGLLYHGALTEGGDVVLTLWKPSRKKGPMDEKNWWILLRLLRNKLKISLRLLLIWKLENLLVTKITVSLSHSFWACPL